MKTLLQFLTIAIGMLLADVPVLAQSSSLFSPSDARPVTLADASYFYVRREPPREIQLHDIVTVIVDEKSQMVSEGRMNRQQRANIDARLQDFLDIDGVGVKPSAQADGDPRVRGLLNIQDQAQANMQTRGGLQFRIAATVVDIRPNGNLVIEARRYRHNNDEITEASLSGIVRREDVLPNNTVLSEDVAELNIYTHEEGHVRDSYRRGWLWRVFDRWKPF